MDDRKPGRYDDPFSRENWPANHSQGLPSGRSVPSKSPSVDRGVAYCGPGLFRGIGMKCYPVALLRGSPTCVYDDDGKPGWYCPQGSQKQQAPADGAPCIYDGVPVDCR
jgi:hypothetical protein